MGKVRRFFRAPVLWMQRLLNALRRHWLRTAAVALPLLVCAIVVAESSTQVRWGSVGEWVAGLGALSAVVVALWSQQRNHAREETYRNEDRERWNVNRAEDWERWNAQRDAEQRRDLAERAERAYRELDISTHLERSERLVELEVTVRNNGQFPYRDLRVALIDPDIKARMSAGSTYVLELKPGDASRLDIGLTPEIMDEFPVYFTLTFEDNHGNNFTYTHNYDGDRVTPD